MRSTYPSAGAFMVFGPPRHALLEVVAGYRVVTALSLELGRRVSFDLHDENGPVPDAREGAVIRRAVSANGVTFFDLLAI